MEKFKCHDCKTLLDNGDEYIPYTVGNEVFIKCKPCYKKDSVLRNFQKTEVYSRIVGYIRPIDQWNKGKKAEWKDRKPFNPKIFI